MYWTRPTVADRRSSRGKGWIIPNWLPSQPSRSPLTPSVYKDIRSQASGYIEQQEHRVNMSVVMAGRTYRWHEGEKKVRGFPLKYTELISPYRSTNSWRWMDQMSKNERHMYYRLCPLTICTSSRICSTLSLGHSMREDDPGRAWWQAKGGLSGRWIGLTWLWWRS